jgi:hypothetical protein
VETMGKPWENGAFNGFSEAKLVISKGFKW